MIDEERIIYVLLGVMITIFAGLVINAIIFECTDPEIRISDETGLDICQQLTGELDTNFEVSSDGEKLYCKKPSFDNTQNIIVEG